jgi:hypothetical protein
MNGYNSWPYHSLHVCYWRFPLPCRRLLLDDSRGVAEALNETVCVLDQCKGLTVSKLTDVGTQSGNELLFFFLTASLDVI